MDPSVLLEQLRAGNPKAFRAVYDQHWKLVVHILRSYRIPGDMQDDLLQEVFITLFKNAGSIQNPERIKAWIATTARNRALDEIRKTKASRIEATDQKILEEISDEKDTADAVDREVQARIAEKFLQMIDKEPGAETLRQFYIEGKSAKQIATERSESISTVTTRLTRLRRRFQDTVRTMLENERSSKSSLWEKAGE